MIDDYDSRPDIRLCNRVLLTAKENDLRNAFISLHNGDCEVVMHIHFTGIGTAVVMKCKTCNCKSDITDYGRW
jgi:hypothetical protein